jgi:hypothetical protein
LFPNIILFIYNRFIGCENETILSTYKEREREREREREKEEEGNSLADLLVVHKTLLIMMKKHSTKY